MVDPYEDRTAEAVCTFAFSSGPGAEPIIFQGRREVREPVFKHSCFFLVKKLNPLLHRDALYQHEGRPGLVGGENEAPIYLDGG